MKRNYAPHLTACGCRRCMDALDARFERIMRQEQWPEWPDSLPVSERITPYSASGLATCYRVIENTPGYMPEAEPVLFYDETDAILYAQCLAEQIASSFDAEAVRQGKYLWSIPEANRAVEIQAHQRPYDQEDDEDTRF